MRTYYATRAKFLWLALSLMVVVPLILAACGESPTTVASPSPTSSISPTSTTSSITPTAVVMVNMVDMPGYTYGFTPTTLNIKVGTEVIWTNGTGNVHTVTSDTGTVINSPLINPKETFSMTFTKVGTFNYYCKLHTYMKGTVIVS